MILLINIENMYKKTLDKLSKAGLYLDINKCEFECKETKYLGFII